MSKKPKIIEGTDNNAIQGMPQPEKHIDNAAQLGGKTR